MKICFYDGYIRNQKQLCKRLHISPETSREKTERKILTAAYACWKYDMVNHLNGAFCFALYDEEQQTYFCARDAFGIKSLYYHITAGGELVCASDIQPIAENQAYKKAIDMQALQYYIMFGYPIGEKTLYQGISKLPAGSTLLYQNKKCTIERYFTPVYAPDSNISQEEWVLKISKTIQEVLDEDRSCFDFGEGGSFLSGGVDSSYLLALSGIKNAFTIDYDIENTSEIKYARSAAGALDVALNSEKITAKKFFEEIPSFLKNTELPVADPSAVAFSLGCKSAVKKTKFCLSGEGADEFFAGYHIYRRAQELGSADYYGCYGVMEAPVACRLLGLKTPYPCDDLIKNIKKDSISDNLNKMLATDIALWLEGDILFHVNRSSTKNGLQVLLPLADKRVFELSAKIPAALKAKDGCEKYIFRQAANRYLPDEISFRKKAGFPVPMKNWMREESIRESIESVLFGKTAEQFFNMKGLKVFLRNFYNGNDAFYSIIYTIYIFLIWYEEVFQV